MNEQAKEYAVDQICDFWREGGMIGGLVGSRTPQKGTVKERAEKIVDDLLKSR